jgi:hypothetical protein
MPGNEGPGRPQLSQKGTESVIGGAWRTTDRSGIGPTASFLTPRYPVQTRTHGNLYLPNIAGDAEFHGRIRRN